MRARWLLTAAFCLGLPAFSYAQSLTPAGESTADIKPVETDSEGSEAVPRRGDRQGAG